MDENSRPADVPQTLPHHPEKEQHGSNPAPRKLHSGDRLQYPCYEITTFLFQLLLSMKLVNAVK